VGSPAEEEEASGVVEAGAGAYAMDAGVRWFI